MFKNQNNHKGMSYIEVAICLFAVSIVILPLSQAFVASVKLKEETKSISQSTFYAETLLEEVKNRLQEDLLTERKIETEYEEEVLNPLVEFLGIEPDDLESFEQNYDTQKYTYEVALWNIGEILAEEGSVISFEESSLIKASRFYTGDEDEKNKAFQFKDSELNSLPWYDAKQYKLFFSDKNFVKSYIPKKNPDNTVSNENSNISALGRIKLSMVGSSITADIDEEDPVIDRVNPVVIGNTYICKLETLTGKAMIIVDTRLLDKTKVENISFEFKNSTAFQVAVKILFNKSDLNDLSKKIYISGGLNDVTVVEDDDEAVQPIPKIVVERVTELDEEKDYLIGMIVRDKSPKWGNAGKIVKTMMDIYSFENSQE
jgi:hypothetical protein